MTCVLRAFSFHQHPGDMEWKVSLAAGEGLAVRRERRVRRRRSLLWQSLGPSLPNFQLSLSLLNSDPKRNVRRRKARVVVAELIISATDSQRGSFSSMVRNAGAEMIDLIAFVPRICASLQQ